MATPNKPSAEEMKEFIRRCKELARRMNEINNLHPQKG